MTDDIIEVSKSRLAVLESVNSLKESLWADPEIGPQMKELVKKKFPNANIPEVDVARAAKKAEVEVASKLDEKINSVSELITNFQKKLEERDEKETKKTEEKEFEQEVLSVKKKYQLSSEGMDKVFARMKEKNNPDIEAAAAWVTDHEVKAPVDNSSYSPQSHDLYGANSGADEWAELNKNPIAYGDKEIGRMVNDFQNGRFDRYKEFGGSL